MKRSFWYFFWPLFLYGQGSYWAGWLIGHYTATH